MVYISVEDFYKKAASFEALTRQEEIECAKQMKSGDIDGLKETIIKREVHLKGVSRAKTKHVGEFKKDAWFGGKKLDYRFPDAQTIINDIFEGEKDGAESK